MSGKLTEISTPHGILSKGQIVYHVGTNKKTKRLEIEEMEIGGFKATRRSSDKVIFRIKPKLESLGQFAWTDHKKEFGANCISYDYCRGKFFVDRNDAVVRIERYLEKIRDEVEAKSDQLADWFNQLAKLRTCNL